MRSGFRAFGLLVAAVAAASVGCSGSDPLRPGNFDVQFATGATNQPSGNDDYECVVFDVVSLTIEPLDPAAAGDLAAPLFVGGNQFINFTGENCPYALNTLASDPLRLPSGAYGVGQFLANLNGSVFAPTMQDLDGSSPTITCIGPLDLTDALMDDVIRVDSDTAVTVVFDVQGAVDAFQSGGCEELLNSFGNLVSLQQ